MSWEKYVEGQTTLSGFYYLAPAKNVKYVKDTFDFTSHFVLSLRIV